MDLSKFLRTLSLLMEIYVHNKHVLSSHKNAFNLRNDRKIYMVRNCQENWESCLICRKWFENDTKITQPERIYIDLDSRKSSMPCPPHKRLSFKLLINFHFVAMQCHFTYIHTQCNCPKATNIQCDRNHSTIIFALCCIHFGKHKLNV